MSSPSAFDDPKVYVYARKRVLEGASLRELALEVGVSKTSALRFRQRIKAEMAGEPVKKRKPAKQYSSRDRIEAVEAYLFQGLSKHEVVERFGLGSVKTLNPWIRKYQAGGPEALKFGHECAHMQLPQRERELAEALLAAEAEIAYLKALTAGEWDHL